MIILNEKWADIGYGDKETTGRWIYDRFYGPICEIIVKKFENNRIRIKIQRAYGEASSSIDDFQMVCLIAKEFLEDYSEVAITLPRIGKVCNFNKKEDVEETLTKLIKKLPLII